MKFDLEYEGKFIKARFVALLIALFVLIAGIAGAFAGIVNGKKSNNVIITPEEVSPEEIAAQKRSVTTLVNQDTSGANANELRMRELELALKVKGDSIAKLQSQLQQPMQTQRDDVQNLLVENRKKDGTIEDLQKQLKAAQDNKSTVIVNKVPDAAHQELATKNLQDENRRKDSKIEDLQKQLKAAQNNKSTVVVNKVPDAAYQELVSRNKYLDFDVRSLVKSNLQLTKENSTLKKSLQEANSQLKKN